MSLRGKLLSAAVAVIAATSLLTGVTTAYMLRPSTPEPAVAALTSPAPPAPPAARVAPRHAAVAVPGTWQAAPPTRVSTTTPSACESGGDRALSIAKPGALGTLVGAGLGAAGGAIANGGKGAGKGALIGGITGAAVGTGYGAYKVKNECGTIFG